MGVVVELARRGSDLNTGAEKDRVYSSKYPSIPIAYKLKVTLTISGATPVGTLIPIFQHNLNFKPVFQIEEDEDGDGQWRMGAPFEFMCDETRILATAPGVAVTAYFYITIYLRPIEEEFTSVVKTPFERGGGNRSDKAVFKIARQGFDISERDDRKFVINTRNKFLPVHKSGLVPVTSTGGVFHEIEHNLGYPPLFWLYYSYDSAISPTTAGYYRYLIGAVATETVTGAHKVDNNKLYVFVTTPGEYAYIIFKDPIAS